eukprot:CAMPEP_0194250064 /NCGR_PEP_ID=MMETSP0158-20130606/22012_1 /TAXON_ID=33649 /ORGANISM="Thalassionema nitzschioides, Strain L26-B" /LENGTH=340 /DNA_ID=CAMNT_0038986743 /DNA_START=128 /DNA_END=1147 /DNA_ORIENTATION=+
MASLFLFFILVIHLPSYYFGMMLNIPTKEIAPYVQMPVISIGCGGLEHGKAKLIVSNWLSLGGRGIDTALNYGNQEEVKAAIDEYNNVTREEVFITTKIPNCDIQNIMHNVQKDLHLLGTDYLNLLLIHGPRNGDCAFAWKEMEKIYAANLTRAIGVSNFHRQHLETVLQNATIVPHVNQIQLNILRNDPETIDFSMKHGITVEAYSPLGRANHSGDISGNVAIQEIAKRHDVTTYQIALRWIVQHNWILTFQSSSTDHQATDADIFGFELTENEMKKLDNLSGIPSKNFVCSIMFCRTAYARTFVAFSALVIGLFIVWRCRRVKIHHHSRLNEHTFKWN